MAERQFTVALVGACQWQGKAILELLEQRELPIERLIPVDRLEPVSDEADDEGELTLRFRQRRVEVRPIEQFDFAGVDLVISVLTSAESEAALARALEAGCVVIDGGSSAASKDAPLLVPAVNGAQLAHLREHRVFASPSTAVVALAQVLRPLQQEAGLAAIQVFACQPVADSGKAAIDELAGQTARLLNAQPLQSRVFPHQIAFNIIAQVGAVDESGYTEAEQAIARELGCVLAATDMPIEVSCLQVPVFYGHGAFVHLRLDEPLSAERAAECLTAAGIVVQTDTVPTAVESDDSLAPLRVGRLRQSNFEPTSLNLWVQADDMRHGVVLNCVQLADFLLESYF